MTSNRLSRRHLLLAAIAAPLHTAVARDAWAALVSGGGVVMIRHAITTPGVGDPPGFKLEECATQRNLTGEGRAHAQRIGAAFRERGVVVERVLSSPWCRCLDTARLAFGTATVSTALSNLFTHPEQRAAQVPQMRALVAGWRGRGTLVLVSHGATIGALTGVSPDTGEMVVLRPKPPNEFERVGRISV